MASILAKLFYILSREEQELRGTAQLLTRWFRYPFLARLGSLILTLIGVPSLLGLAPAWIGVFLGMALMSELLGRYLFFVTVVPKNRPEGYF